MKKLFFLFFLTCMLLMSYNSQAQFKDWGVKFGLHGSLLFPENEYANLGFTGNDNFSFDWYKTSWLAEAFIGAELSRLFEIRLSGGYGFYTNKALFAKGTDYGEYKSTIIPVIVKLRVSPFDLKYWNPYFYVGGGLMKYNLDTAPEVISPVRVETSGWVANIPAGFGAEFAVSDGILLDFAVGGAFGSTWDLDGYSSKNSKTWDSYLHTTLGLSFTWENCQSDNDMDELGKCDEEMLHTKPDNPDSDDDGLLDGEEYHSYKTNPAKADTDGDGLKDGMEALTSRTDPLKADTDGDGLNDGEEYKKYKTSPLVTDSDKDGLSDSYEIMTSRSNPLVVDTDKDGLTDTEEVQKYKTNPLIADTDGDGLTDSEEVLKNRTDPLNKDTDRGSVNDLTEVVRGTDPLNADDDVVKMDVPIVLEGITFATGKADITPESVQVLMKALNTMETYPEIFVEISGHTDNVGSSSSNQRLSESRAMSVRNWLISKGIPAERITARGYGEDVPRVPNDTAENKRLNRRIEFKRIK